MKQLLTLLCLTCFVFPQASSADQYDPQLRSLFTRLQNIRDTRITNQIEAEIWRVWIAHEQPEFNTLMITGIQRMNSSGLVAALVDFNRLIEIAPDYAEAWNKRATIYYLLGDYEASRADITQTLLLEPKHFGALSGLGLIHMTNGDYLLARNAFNSALEINPNMQSVKNNLDAMAEYFDNTAI